jgi:hypothetical protein
MVTGLILDFPDWGKVFHVHLDAFGIDLGNVMTQQGEGTLDHLIYFANRKFSWVEHIYTTNKQEGFAMVYALQNFMYLV